MATSPLSVGQDGKGKNSGRSRGAGKGKGTGSRLGSRELRPTGSNPAEPELMVKASSRVLTAESLLEGDALLRCAVENLEGFQELFPSQLGQTTAAKLPEARLSWASACSGSEGAYYCVEALNKAFAFAKIPVKLKHVFSCEANKDKQKWIHVVLSCGPVLPEVENLQMASGLVRPEAGSKDLEMASRLVRPDAESEDLQMVSDLARPKSEIDDLEMASGRVRPEAESAESSDDEPAHACIFADVQDLGGETAFCVVHNGHCQVPTSDVFVCGVSCKDISRPNPRRDPSKPVLAEAESPGGSAQTWAGFKGFVSTKMPGIVIFENVDAIDDQSSDAGGGAAANNMDLVLITMSGFGYEAQSLMTDASQFGCTARRRRVYICFIRKGYRKFSFQERTMTEVVSMFRSMTASCARSPPCASEVLLDPRDDAVAAGLFELQVKRSKANDREEKAKAKAKENPKTKSKPGGQGWIEQHLKFTAREGMRWGEPVGPDLEVNEWFLTLSDREKDVLMLSRSQAPEVAFRNLSQSVGRVHSNTFCRQTQRHIAPTMLPSQLLWVEVTKPPRLLLGRESLCYVGFPIRPFLRKMDSAGYEPGSDPLPDHDLANPAAPARKKQRRSDRLWLTEAFMADLAGNAMALPVLLAILQSAVCAVDMRETAPAITQQDTQAALAAFDLVSP